MTNIVDLNVLWALSGGVMLAVSASTCGTFAHLNHRSLIGDALAHCALPGVMIAFLLTHNNHVSVVFVGGVLASLAGYVTIDWLIRHHRVKPDSALAIVLSLFFSLGVLMLSIIQRQPIPGKGGLDKLFFGQAAALLPDDLYLLAIVLTSCLVTITATFSHLRACAFDSLFARAVGIDKRHCDLMIGLLLVGVVVTGLQLVGVILMSALLITPVLIARQWSSRLPQILLLGAVASTAATVFGIVVSASSSRFPTGPWVVIGLAVLFVFSALLSPRSGLLARTLKSRCRRYRNMEEHLLRAAWLLTERNTKSFSLNHLLTVHHLPPQELVATASRLLRAGLLTLKGHLWQLSPAGEKRAAELTRHHRLWERYLMEKTLLPVERLHGVAEDAEHVITTEMAERIEGELEFSHTDPHGRAIPPS